MPPAPARPADDPALAVFQSRLSSLISDAEKLGKGANLSSAAAASAKRALSGAVELAKKARSGFARAAAELQKAAKAARKPTAAKAASPAPAVGGGERSKAPPARRGPAAPAPPSRARSKPRGKTATRPPSSKSTPAKAKDKDKGPAKVGGGGGGGGGGLFQVAAILDDRVVARKGRAVHEVLVQWEGFPGEDSWEPVRNFAKNEVWHAYADAKKKKKK